jgi:hypothetical protein
MRHESSEAVSGFADRAGRIRYNLRVRGWSRFDAADMNLSAAERSGLSMLADYAQALPVDRFGGNGRHRSYAEGVLSPASRSVSWKDGQTAADGSVEMDYRQEHDYQPEYGGVTRRFRRTGDAILALPLINKLIWFDLALTPLAERHRTLLCGFHLIRMTALPGGSARITPDCLHRDGQPFTAVHLITRHGAGGGVNYIAPPGYSGYQVETVPSQLLADFTLDHPLDSYVIDDEAICHHVTALTCDHGAACGVRTIVLIDFSPVAVCSEVSS